MNTNTNHAVPHAIRSDGTVAHRTAAHIAAPSTNDISVVPFIDPDGTETWRPVPVSIASEIHDATRRGLPGMADTRKLAQLAHEWVTQADPDGEPLDALVSGGEHVSGHQIIHTDAAQSADSVASLLTEHHDTLLTSAAWAYGPELTHAMHAKYGYDHTKGAHVHTTAKPAMRYALPPVHPRKAEQTGLTSNRVFVRRGQGQTSRMETHRYVVIQETELLVGQTPRTWTIHHLLSPLDRPDRAMLGHHPYQRPSTIKATRQRRTLHTPILKSIQLQDLTVEQVLAMNRGDTIQVVTENASIKLGRTQQGWKIGNTRRTQQPARSAQQAQTIIKNTLSTTST